MEELKKEFESNFFHKNFVDMDVCTGTKETIWSWFEAKLKEEREKAINEVIQEVRPLSKDIWNQLCELYPVSN